MEQFKCVSDPNNSKLTFTRKENLIKHMKAVHSRERDLLQCPNCLQTCVNNQTLCKHNTQRQTTQSCGAARAARAARKCRRRLFRRRVSTGYYPEKIIQLLKRYLRILRALDQKENELYEQCSLSIMEEN